MKDNGFFQQMCKEAYDEIASGKKGWKDVDTNTLLMACFHGLFNHLTHKITKPLWFFAGSVGAAVIGYLVQSFI